VPDYDKDIDNGENDAIEKMRMMRKTMIQKTLIIIIKATMMKDNY